ncbi:MAG: hypothetical protein ACPK7O_05035 [Methanobacterium sp.]
MANSKNHENRTSRHIDPPNFKHKEIQCPDCGLIFPSAVSNCKSCGKTLHEPVEENKSEETGIPIELENLNSYRNLLKINGFIFLGITISIIIIIIMNYI